VEEKIADSPLLEAVDAAAAAAAAAVVVNKIVDSPSLEATEEDEVDHV
jgi:hypothetical protein